MNKDKLFRWAFHGFVFAIPLTQFVSARALAVLVVFSLFIKPSKAKLYNIPSQSWDIGLYLLVLIAGCFYSDDLSSALRVLETNFSFLAMPLVFMKLKDDGSDNFTTLSYAFFLGVLSASLVSFGLALAGYIQSGDINNLLSYRLTESIQSHPTYLAYYIIFAITIGLYLMYYEHTPVSPRWLVAILTLFLFVPLMLTSGSTAFISILLIFSFFILKYLLEERSTSRHIVFGLVVTMMLAFFIALSERFGITGLLEKGDYFERTLLWESALNANPNPLFGVGTGDYTRVLNEYYSNHDLTAFAAENFNAHNQFIQLYLSNGLLGLFALLVLLVRPLYLSMRNHYPIGVLILFPFVIYGMNEVFLGRFQGVVFFVFLHQMVMHKMTSPQLAHSEKLGYFS